MVQGHVFLKKRGWGRGADNFPIWFFQGCYFKHLEIILLFAKLCHTFEEKLFVSAIAFFWKKVILSCLKMNLCLSVRKLGVWLGQDKGCLSEGGETVWNALKVGGIDDNMGQQLLKGRGGWGEQANLRGPTMKIIWKRTLTLYRTWWTASNRWYMNSSI